jgi:hypothetical protein
LASALFAAGLLGAAGAAPGPTPSADLELLDLDGQRVKPLRDPAARAFVFVLARTDCPISNRYAPELQRLHRRFAPAGVVFRLVYPDRAETVEGIRRHLQEFGYPFGALRDPEHDLVRMVQAKVTPEVAVFVAGPAGPRLAYRGRIDDRYVDFGTTRAAPTTRDLLRTLEAVVAGEVPPLRTTAAVGCFLSPAE